MLLAQISDLHVKPPGALAYRRVDTAASLARCIAKLNALTPRPDAVIMTGDLVDRGTPEEYAHLKSLLAALELPYYLLVGNHDAREPLRAAFAERPELRAGGEFVQYAADVGPLRVIALDSMQPGQSAGALCDARLDWLAAQLEDARGRPTIVALHHPPFDCGIAHMDAIRLAPEASTRLEALVARYPNIERVICGHVHRPMFVRFGGTIASAVPAPAHQVTLDLRADGPSAFSLEPPAFALHRYDPRTGIVTHHAYVDDADGPYPFHDPGGDLIA
ncbi:phosphodiesterase [Paraburkholderia caballeronis]|uniref:3',5'-cyclic AMP phosphodiesterase CpdA n=1 Tax=Paraburkholderia caballeronis TaxID=416943 RepID=A0A1H7MSL7_9BURK|nr:phosphodiesterase [Paraburkholderia caballeronis]PXW26457.1 3',5'-cyclic AMP phosphodiesterase CpdA [Paraburkholderia caballeronis]PXX02004.1 3',5'-cyclic AMP phosphodiesterase CpdA [Paraburkholderia caballeronis]RAK01161.1 3',5'-cyclic AMP phosphodiesterase CpdA [Paraburkholderia caballeronis]SEB94305.1 3',5'-cyclic AMP phosphodiesterase CpdA [Paraburkholderia caballeronis]SEL13798.1 3',5'-cyclic AMP phosphodiesterase CpdA [Paraburkholderia caballeronis]